MCYVSRLTSLFQYACHLFPGKLHVLVAITCLKRHQMRPLVEILMAKRTPTTNWPLTRPHLKQAGSSHQRQNSERNRNSNKVTQHTIKIRGGKANETCRPCSTLGAIRQSDSGWPLSHTPPSQSRKCWNMHGKVKSTERLFTRAKFPMGTEQVKTCYVAVSLSHTVAILSPPHATFPQ